MTGDQRRGLFSLAPLFAGSRRAKLALRGLGRGALSTRTTPIDRPVPPHRSRLPRLRSASYGGQVGSNPPYALGTEEVENSFRKGSLPVGPEPWEEELSTNRHNGG